MVGGSGSTALGYQMMVESTILHAMTDAARIGNFYIASAYAKAYADLIGFDEKGTQHLPDQPELSRPQSRKDWESGYEAYYFKMLSVIFNQVRKTLEEVRKRYKNNKDIPEPDV